MFFGFVPEQRSCGMPLAFPHLAFHPLVQHLPLVGDSLELHLSHYLLGDLAPHKQNCFLILKGMLSLVTLGSVILLVKLWNGTCVSVTYPGKMRVEKKKLSMAGGLIRDDKGLFFLFG